MPSPAQTAHIELIKSEQAGNYDANSLSSQLRQRLFSSPEGINVDAWIAESGMTRSAVTSAVQQLKKYGFDVEANDGTYRLLNPQHEPDLDHYERKAVQSEKLRKRIAKALQDGKTVTAESMRCGAQELGSHIRYLRREMSIDNIASGDAPAEYALTGTAAEASTNGTTKKSSKPKKVPSKAMTLRGQPLELAEAPVVADVQVSPLPKLYRPVPQVDDTLRVQAVARRDESTVIVELAGPNGEAFVLEVAADVNA